MPAHQFPSGVVLGSLRRAELLDWAEDVDGLIVEDDYDSELRYDRDPVGALQGLALADLIERGQLDRHMRATVGQTLVVGQRAGEGGG
jgi:GntR family transcriptional regulator / MocR family aminotransferase